ncbi:MAG TPA: 50S ribosomal protein L11 methyltransferase [Gemmatimonadales bacterium]|nr:50S ribosomal protein L11 methyltransferase [Gemmatimonadales bacterium]
MTWWAIDVRTAAEHRAAVGAWLVARTGHAVEERDDGTLVGFAADEGEADRVAAALVREVAAPLSTARRPLQPVDWSLRWRDGLEPRRIGRLTLAPSWLASAAVEPAVVLDPEMAFGSGEHGSTRGALTLLERHLRPGDRVLDLGSGSGILAIAAVKLGAARATGIEIDPEANEVAERNASRNGVARRVAFLHGDAAVLAPLAAPVELVCSNILRNVNTALLPAVRHALAPGGLAVFAGMEAPEAPLFRDALTAAAFDPVDEITDAGWWAVAARPR